MKRYWLKLPLMEKTLSKLLKKPRVFLSVPLRFVENPG